MLSWSLTFFIIAVAAAFPAWWGCWPVSRHRMALRSVGKVVMLVVTRHRPQLARRVVRLRHDAPD